MTNSSVEDARKVVQWVQSNLGFWNDKLEVKESKLGGVGVFAKQDLTNLNEDLPIVLMRIAKESLLSTRTCCINNLLYERQFDGTLGLVLGVIYELDQLDQSPWSDYLSSFKYTDSKGRLILPPGLWTKEEKFLLRGTELEIMGGLDDEQDKSVYETACEFAISIKELVKPPYCLDIEDVGDEKLQHKYQTFVAISRVISSRDFEVDAFHEIGLVPGADLFNHDLKPTVRFESFGDVCEMCGSVAGCDHMAQEDGCADDDCQDGCCGGREPQDPHGCEDSACDGCEEDRADGCKDQCCEKELNEDEDDCEDDSESESEIEEIDEIDLEYVNNLELKLYKRKQQEEKASQEMREQDRKLLEESGQNIPPIEFSGKQIEADECVDIILTNNVKAGDELFNSYGKFNNSVLLSKYGFVIPDNRNDYVGLGMEFLKIRKENKKLYSRQFAWWESQGYLLFKDYLNTKKNANDDDEEEHDDEDNENTWTLDVQVGYKGEPSQVTQGLIKLLTMSHLELDKFIKKDESKINFGTLLTKSGKYNKLLKDILLKRRSKYSEIPANLKFKSERVKMAVTLAKSEKEIIERALKLCN